MKKTFFIAIIVMMSIVAGCSSKTKTTSSPITTPDNITPILTTTVTPALTPTKTITDTVTTSINPENQTFNNDQIIIKEATFSKPGYIVIHLSENNKPGKVLESTSIFEAGQYTNIAIKTNKLTTEANKLFAMIHFDDGDSIYEFPGDDKPAKTNDKVVVKPFTVTVTSMTTEKIIPPTEINLTPTQKQTDTAVLNITPTKTIKEFNVIAKQFDFTPSTITVNKGDTVKLNVTSVDVAHGLTISEFNVSEVIDAGKTKNIEFIADKAGTFTMFCSVFCGAGHSGMKGTLIVK